MQVKDFIDAVESKGGKAHIQKNDYIYVYGNDLDLSNLDSIPDKVHFQNDGNLYLNDIEKVPETTCIKNNGDVILHSEAKFTCQNNGIVINAIADILNY